MKKEDLFEPNCIRTYSGHYIDPFSPDPNKINIIDIAHQLSNQNRWSGATEHPYSVASHSVWMMKKFDDPIDKLAALLHDSSEAYIGDMPKPIKDRLPDYRNLEDVISKCIAKKYSCVYPWELKIHLADRDSLYSEWDNIVLHGRDHNLRNSKVDFIEAYKSIRNALPHLPEINA